MRRVAKFLAALAAAAATVLVSALSDGHVSAVEGVQIAICAATAAGVWVTANVPAMTWAKAAVAVVLAALNPLVSYLAAGGLTGAEWVNVGLAAVGALAVYLVPNRAAAEPAPDPAPEPSPDAAPAYVQKLPPKHPAT